MKRALALLILASSVAEQASLCNEPVLLYKSCDFIDAIQSLKVSSGATIEHVKGGISPKAVYVPEGCRAVFYTKSLLTFSSTSPSHGVAIIGPRKTCFHKKMSPVALEINHNIDAAQVLKEIHANKGNFVNGTLRWPTGPTNRCPSSMTFLLDGKVCMDQSGKKCDVGYTHGNPEPLISSCEFKGYVVDMEKRRKHPRPWNLYPCPSGLFRYGDGSACRIGSKNCDLGYVSGSPNTNMPSCEIKCYVLDMEKRKKHPKPWNLYPCPSGLSRYGDGSACRDVSRNCDLGYVSGSPNTNMPSCEIKGYVLDMEKHRKHPTSWNFYPCPSGLSRYGDGSACRGGSRNCDLGYVSGNPNTNRPSCEIKDYFVDMEKRSKHPRPWNFYPCPSGLSRYGDGSACLSGSRNCDLGYVSGNPNNNRPSCWIKGYVVDMEMRRKHPRPWNLYPCPFALSRYGDGSACRGGSKNCDLGYVSGNPNTNMPSCEIEGYVVDMEKRRKHPRPWNLYPCPSGLSRFGDGSACRGDSKNCDLGYISGNPNKLPPCSRP